MIWRKIKQHAEFFKFCVVGVSGALLDFSILNLLVIVFFINVYFAALISFLVAATSNFLLNKYWTFCQVRQKIATRHQYLIYLIVSLAGLLINLLVMALLIEGIDLWYNWAKAMAIIVVGFWNYFMNKFWTFKSTQEKAVRKKTI